MKNQIEITLIEDPNPNVAFNFAFDVVRKGINFTGNAVTKEDTPGNYQTSVHIKFLQPGTEQEMEQIQTASLEINDELYKNAEAILSGLDELAEQRQKQ